jgi:hypothetical protein
MNRQVKAMTTDYPSPDGAAKSIRFGCGFVAGIMLAASGTFAGLRALAELFLNGTTGTFALQAFVAMVFRAASFMKESTVRDVLTWLGMDRRG